MPVFSRTKLIIHDDCLSVAPGSVLPGVPYLILTYEGPNPQRLYEKIKELLATIFRHDPGEVQERDFVWDKSEVGEKFRVRFELIKDMDRFTFLQIIVTLSGEAKPSKEFGKEGSARIRIEGRVRTEYPQDTLWERSLLYEMLRVFYHRVIYEERRQRYKNQCREWLLRLQDELKLFLNILPRER